MAVAHRGYSTADDTRLRILLGVFDAAHHGMPPSRAELRQRTGLANGSLAHHIPRLATQGLLALRTGHRRLILTQDGLAALAAAGLIAPVAPAPAYTLTTRGLEFLERAPRQAVQSVEPAE
ncbi:MAG TPA: hypothetical protein VHB98_24220 [Chloroflexota bacterium]|jgi:hypothetical protein|nr:hypothetical protein [Chloroflexota bacterium]